MQTKSGKVVTKVSCSRHNESLIKASMLRDGWENTIRKSDARQRIFMVFERPSREVDEYGNLTKDPTKNIYTHALDVFSR